MRTAVPEHSAYGERVSPRRRLVSLALALAATTLLILMLLGLAPSLPDIANKAQQLITIAAPEDQRSATIAKTKRASGGAKPKVVTRPVPPTPTPPQPPAADTPLNIMIVSKEVFAASDISKLPSHANEQVANAGGNGNSSGAASGDDSGGGTGPHGERLYNAQWYREPQQAELNYYIHSSVPPGAWATIACKTIPDYRVEDCQELDESPPGSGLARAIRQAAGSFLVRPPRVGGKSLVGEWVRIRIDFTDRPRGGR